MGEQQSGQVLIQVFEQRVNVNSAALHDIPLGLASLPMCAEHQNLDHPHSLGHTVHRSQHTAARWMLDV